MLTVLLIAGAHAFYGEAILQEGSCAVLWSGDNPGFLRDLPDLLQRDAVSFQEGDSSAGCKMSPPHLPVLKYTTSHKEYRGKGK